MLRSYKLRLSLYCLLTAFLNGCTTISPLPEVDLSAPGWTVWTGQALWQVNSEQSAIAGEIVLARHQNNDVLISFAKPPVPIFTAQTSGKRWKIDLIHTQRSHSGSGNPPSRFVWFQIPALIQDSTMPKGWQVEQEDDSTWFMRNPDSGETIRLVLD